jgi:hypothetical protein
MSLDLIAMVGIGGVLALAVAVGAASQAQLEGTAA